jgi:hypothetical protein
MQFNSTTATGALYIANARKQDHLFEFRLSGQKTPRRYPIPSLTQVNIGGRNGLTGMEIEQIVKQHRKYGLVSVDEIDHTRPFIGLIYSTNKPVSVANLQFTIKHNDEVLMERGQEIRKAAAIATNNALESSPELKRMGANIDELEMTIVEQETKSNPEPTLAEGVVVSKDAREENEPQGKRQARKARSR